MALSVCLKKIGSAAKVHNLSSHLTELGSTQLQLVCYKFENILKKKSERLVHLRKWINWKNYSSWHVVFVFLRNFLHFSVSFTYQFGRPENTAGAWFGAIIAFSWYRSYWTRVSTNSNLPERTHSSLRSATRGCRTKASSASSTRRTIPCIQAGDHQTKENEDKKLHDTEIHK